MTLYYRASILQLDFSQFTDRTVSKRSVTRDYLFRKTRDERAQASNCHNQIESRGRIIAHLGGIKICRDTFIFRRARARASREKGAGRSARKVDSSTTGACLLRVWFFIPFQAVTLSSTSLAPKARPSAAFSASFLRCFMALPYGVWTHVYYGELSHIHSWKKNVLIYSFFVAHVLI